MDSINNINQSLYNNTFQQHKMGSTYSNELDGNSYMTLFIQSLLNQNPLEPMSNGEMMQQLSQLTMMETVEQMKSSVEDLMLSQNLNPLSNYSNFIGKKVMVHNSEGKIEGEVLAIGMQGSEIMFEMDNGGVYPIVDIVGVSEFISEQGTEEMQPNNE